MATIIRPSEPPKFQWEFTCKHCQARIDSDIRDLRFGNFGNAMDPVNDLADDRYYVTCPSCDKANFPPSHKLDERTRRFARENSRRR